MENIFDHIIHRLQQSIDRPSITKFYNYSIEELQDNPDRLKDIADYLQLHKGKYEDFDIQTWIDEKTFKPVIMIRLYLEEEYKHHIISTRIEKMINYFSTLKDSQE